MAAKIVMFTSLLSCNLNEAIGKDKNQVPGPLSLGNYLKEMVIIRDLVLIARKG